MHLHGKNLKRTNIFFRLKFWTRSPTIHFQKSIVSNQFFIQLVSCKLAVTLGAAADHSSNVFITISLHSFLPLTVIFQQMPKLDPFDRTKLQWKMNWPKPSMSWRRSVWKMGSDYHHLNWNLCTSYENPKTNRLWNMFDVNCMRPMLWTNMNLTQSTTITY